MKVKTVESYSLTATNTFGSEFHEMAQTGPKIPEYASAAKRLETFRTLPKGSHIEPEELVGVGIFYTGERHKVRCFHCGKGFRILDTGDNPLMLHKQLSPVCPYAVYSHAKGVEQRDKDEKTGSTADDSLTTPAAQSCLEFGYTREQVHAAIWTYKSRNGKRTYSGGDLYRIIADENGECSAASSSASSELLVEGSSSPKGRCEADAYATNGIDIEDDEEDDEEELNECQLCSSEFDAMLDLSMQHMGTCRICVTQATILPRYSAYAIAALRALVRFCEL